MPVEQSHADHGDAQVAGAFQVVSREDAQTAGVLGQGGVEPVFGGEVGDRCRRRGVGAVRELLVPQRSGEVAVEVGGGCVEPGAELCVGGELPEPFRGDFSEQPDGVPAHGFPEAGLHRSEYGARRGVPRPPQVGGQGAQCSELVRQNGTDGKPTNSLHESGG